MLKSLFAKIRANRILQIIAAITLLVTIVGVSSFAAPKTATAATTTVSINLIYYGTNSNATDQSIISANPEYLVDNSSVGPWKGNADISKFMAAGIKYFEYIDGGYEGTVKQAIPNDLQSNLNYIKAIAAAGAYGVFIDEVSSSPSAAQLDYLKQLADYAHSLGLKVVFNAGVDSWSDSLMAYCDFINSSEIWNNAPLTASQTKWQSRTWFLTQGVNDATTAANLTKAAWSKGIEAEYVCSSYMALPTWLASYIAQIASAPAATATATPAAAVTATPAAAVTATPAAAVTATPAAAVTATPAATATATPAAAVTAPPAAAVTATPAAAVTATPAATATVTPAATATTTAPVVAATTTTYTVDDPIGNFFLGLWQSAQGIWDHLLNWLVI